MSFTDNSNVAKRQLDKHKIEMALLTKGVNSICLIGRLGRDPELYSFPDGGAKVRLSIATSERWVDKRTGERKELTEWHRVSMTGSKALVIFREYRKGQMVWVEGQIHYPKQEQKDAYGHPLSAGTVAEIFAQTIQKID